MSRLLKPRDYLKKFLLFILLFGFISLGAIGGCSNNGEGQDNTRALTENDFAADASITVDPEKGHFVTFLEHPESDDPDRDTGDIGTDIFTFEFNRTVTYSPCWDDENEEAAHTMVLLDSEGSEMLRVEANGECPSEIIPAGVYEAVLTHDGQTPDLLPIFGRPRLDNVAVGETGFLDRINGYIIGLLANFDLADGSFAQTTIVNHLIETNKCENCDMDGVDFSNAELTCVDLSGSSLNNSMMKNADLRGADLSNTMMKNTDLRGIDLRCIDKSDGSTSCTDLTKAVLIDADLSSLETADDTIFTNAAGAILSRASMDGANLSNATFSLAKLNGAIMKNTICNSTLFNGTDLIGVNFSGADLTNASFIENLFFPMSVCPTDMTATTVCKTDLTNANLSGVKLSGTRFDMAIWCDGNCVCDTTNSIDNCGGCDPITTTCVFLP